MGGVYWSAGLLVLGKFKPGKALVSCVRAHGCAIDRHINARWSSVGDSAKQAHH